MPNTFGDVHFIGVCSITGSGAYQLNAVDNLRISPEVRHAIEHAGGEVDPSYMAVMQTEPGIGFSALELSTALANIGIAGEAIPQTTVITAAEFFLQKAQPAGTRASGSSHFKIAVNEGLIIPESISWNQGQPARLSLMLHATYDGTNLPFVYTDSVALTTGQVAEAYIFNKAVINGTELKSATGCTVNFGLQLYKDFAAGGVHPVYQCIQRRQPTLEVVSRDAVSLNTFGLTGTAQGATDSVLYFQKLTKNGTPEAEANTSHISMSVDDGMIWVPDSGAGAVDPVGNTVRIQPTYDGTNAILAIATGVAIP